MTEPSSFCVVIPTLNAESFMPTLLNSLHRQTVRPERIIVIDSRSNDRTAEIVREAGAELHVIERSEFNHGGTRNLGLKLAAPAEICVFMTQDALPADDRALELLLEGFSDPKVAVCYGRQLPREGATTIERFARYFNYPDQDNRRSMEQLNGLGFKATFCSNSFAAYRVSSLMSVGGFPNDTIFGEDALAVAAMLLEGSHIVYASKAAVVHSHSYGIYEEFRRYFDIGVMHKRNSDLLDRFGSATSTGMTFVRQELAFIAKNEPASVPEVFVRTATKLAAYRLGKLESHIPLGIKKRMSMHSRFWK